MRLVICMVSWCCYLSMFGRCVCVRWWLIMVIVYVVVLNLLCCGVCLVSLCVLSIIFLVIVVYSVRKVLVVCI